MEEIRRHIFALMVVQYFKLKASASENEFLKGIKAPRLMEVEFDGCQS